MPVDAADKQIVAMFSGLQRHSAAHSIPPPGSLSIALNELVDQTKSSTCTIAQATFGLFATAAVEMWQRSVHSFLISASLTKASPIWSSVSGYYSSHYSIRGFAHLLGFFNLKRKKRIISVELQGNQRICSITSKGAGDREHRFYWKVVKDSPRFFDNPFFTRNEEGSTESDRSDVAHRSKANYADHLDRFPAFEVLDEAYLKHRVKMIASMALSDAPIPRAEAYPDTDNVQLMAYHRLIQLRKFIDGALGESNRYWNAHRNPRWCTNFTDFQIVEPECMMAFRDHLA
jgi:hypothetical protein